MYCLQWASTVYALKPKGIYRLRLHSTRPVQDFTLIFIIIEGIKNVTGGELSLIHLLDIFL